MIVGNKIYEVCSYCYKQFMVNKFLFGSAHICLPILDRTVIDINDAYNRGEITAETAITLMNEAVEKMKNNDK